MKIHTIWSGRAKKTKQQNKTNNNYMLRCTILSQFDLEWKRSGEKLVQLSCFIQTAKKQSGSHLVVSTHTLGRVHILSAKIDEVVRQDWCYSTPAVRLNLQTSLTTCLAWLVLIAEKTNRPDGVRMHRWTSAYMSLMCLYIHRQRTPPVGNSAMENSLTCSNTPVD